MYTGELSDKVKANAAVSYFLIFVSGVFLFNKENPFLNNSFVKSHTKTALIIHLSILINYIIFISFWLGINFTILNYSIDQIIAIPIFIALFIFMLYWAYKAHSWETFSLWKTIKLDKKIKLSTSQNISEKDKLTIILSRIPLLWFIVYPKYKKSPIIENSTKLNLIVSSIIVLLFVFWNGNLSTLLVLAYIIVIVFLSINLIKKNEFLDLNLGKVPNIEKLRLYMISILKYMYIYFTGKKFIWFKDIFSKLENDEKSKLENENKILEKKEDFKLPNLVVYIPIINIISVFNINSKLQKHIINGLIITSLFILSWIFLGFDNRSQIFILFPLAFAIWHLNKELTYEIPFLYDLYRTMTYICTKIKLAFSFLKAKHKEEKSESLKVEK